MTELALIASDTSVVERAADPGQFVIDACTRAKSWLAEALEHGEIDKLVELKSQSEAIRVYTAQKQIGKDAELAAAEVVRRAERGIGVAIRRGQEAGTVATRSEMASYAGRIGRAKQQHDETELMGRKPAPSDFVSSDELSGNGAGIYHMTDGISDGEFEEAITEGKAERNLSRANVVRKVRDKRDAKAMAEFDRSPGGAERRREQIQELAERGYSSAQISEKVGILTQTVRDIARKERIRIPADEALGRGTRKSIDSNRIVRETVTNIEGLVPGLSLVNFGELDAEEIKNWTVSLSESIRALNRLNRQLKEMIQ